MNEKEETRELVDVLAENIYDQWVQEQANKGANDVSKGDSPDDEHCQSIPFSDLSDFEKEGYRNSANKTLKTIHQSGFQIEKPILSDSSQQGAACEEILIRLKKSAPMSYALPTSFGRLWRRGLACGGR